MPFILMCPPDFFGIEYEINPWMHVETKVNESRAETQWTKLVAAYQAAHYEVEVMRPRKGLPDMVFTANAGVVFGGRAVLSSFRFPERQGEEPFFQHEFERLGLEVLRLPRGVSFEGAGDALFLGETLFCGYGFRTDVESHALVGELLRVPTVSLQLVNPSFYHLDTCFSPLSETAAMVVEEAFSRESLETIHKLVPQVVPMPLSLAEGFACNAVCLDKVVYASTPIIAMEETLATLGLTVRAFPMEEFRKSGGGVRCLSLPL